MAARFSVQRDRAFVMDGNQPVLPVTEDRTLVRPKPVQPLPTLGKLTLPVPVPARARPGAAASDLQQLILQNVVGNSSHSWNNVVPVRTESEQVAQAPLRVQAAGDFEPTLPGPAKGGFFDSVHLISDGGDSSTADLRSLPLANGTILSKATQDLQNKVDKGTQEQMLKLNSILSNSHVVVEQLNGYIEQIGRLKEQMLANLLKSQLQKEQQKAKEVSTNIQIETQSLQTEAPRAFSQSTSAAVAAPARQEAKRIPAKAQEKETVGAVQMQFLLDMERAQGKMQAVDDLTQGTKVADLKDKFICKHLNKKHCAKFMCKSCYHQKGNSKAASECGHPDRSHYSQGMCKSCYHKKYYVIKSKRIEKDKSSQAKAKIKK